MTKHKTTTKIAMRNGVPTRVWEGRTKDGIKVQCYIVHADKKEANAAN